MTRDMVMKGYAIRPAGEAFHVYRPGETDPSIFADTVPQALELIAVDLQQGVIGGTPIRCPGCIAAQCGCLPA